MIETITKENKQHAFRILSRVFGEKETAEKHCVPIPVPDAADIILYHTENDNEGILLCILPGILTNYSARIFWDMMNSFVGDSNDSMEDALNELEKDLNRKATT